MAAFNADTTLTIRIGSAISQVDANQKLRSWMRDAIRGGVSLLPEPRPTEAEIAAMNVAQATPHVQRIVRRFLRDLAQTERVRAAEAAAVAPVRAAPDESEDLP